MAKRNNVIDTDDLWRVLTQIEKKIDGGNRYGGHFFGDWVDSQLFMYASDLQIRIGAIADTTVNQLSGKYHNSFTVGEPYTYKGVRSIRVYAARPAYHANLIEYGFTTRAGKGSNYDSSHPIPENPVERVAGKNVFATARQQFDPDLVHAVGNAFEEKMEALIK